MKALCTDFFFDYTSRLFRAAGTVFKYLIARTPFSFVHLRASCNLCLYFWPSRESEMEIRWYNESKLITHVKNLFQAHSGEPCNELDATS